MKTAEKMLRVTIQNDAKELVDCVNASHRIQYPELKALELRLALIYSEAMEREANLLIFNIINIDDII